jgi:cell division control protein 6
MDRDMLMTSHIPLRPPCREPQIKELGFCMSPICKGRKPINALIYGKSGTGKTLAARFLLGKLHQEVGGRGVYVNCWKHNTAYSILDKMNNDMRILGAQSQSTISRISDLQRFMKGKPYVVILDEVNMVPPRERNTVIYHLCEMDNVGIVCISHQDVLHSLEDRVRSRFMPVKVEFPLYSVEELTEILAARAEAALYPDTWDAELLERIASLANGDARAAIGALRCAAEYAERSGDRIKPEDVHEGFVDFRRCDRRRALLKLSEHHRIIYQLIEKNPGITSVRLMKVYEERCGELNTSPVARRTFTHYLSRLRDTGLIREDQAKMRGRVRCFRVR